MIWIFPLLVVLCPFLLALGIVLPLVRFESFYFFSQTPSLLGILATLWGEGDYLLCLLVGLFSVVFPLGKMMATAILLYGVKSGARGSGRVERLLPLLSKWSMMDVMLVALLIFAAKTSGVASAFTQPGLWFYAASAIAAGLLQSMGRLRISPQPPQ
jgi:paraquat-inducible protein A